MDGLVKEGKMKISGWTFPIFGKVVHGKRGMSGKPQWAPFNGLYSKSTAEKVRKEMETRGFKTRSIFQVTMAV